MEEMEEEGYTFSIHDPFTPSPEHDIVIISFLKNKKLFILTIVLAYVGITITHYQGISDPSLRTGFFGFLYADIPLIGMYILLTIVIGLTAVQKSILDRANKNINEENKILRKATTYEELKVAKRKVKELKRKR